MVVTMNKLTTLQHMRDYIKRKLGAPVVNVEIADEQLDDCITDALLKYNEFHYDAVDVGYYILPLVPNKVYYELPDWVFDVTRIVPMNGGDFTQFVDESLLMKPFYVGNSGGTHLEPGMTVLSLEMFRQRFAQIEKYFEKSLSFDYNSTTKKLFLHEAPKDANNISLQIYKSESMLDASVAFNNVWFKKYCAALAKIQWGLNISKFSGATLPGGVTLNGEAIKADGITEKDQLDIELWENYSEPADPMLG